MKNYGFLFKDIINRVVEERLNERIIKTVELVPGLQLDLQIKRLKQCDVDYITGKYASVLYKSLTDMTPKEIVLMNEYKYDIIMRACVCPPFNKDDLKEFDVMTVQKIFETVAKALCEE